MNPEESAPIELIAVVDYGGFGVITARRDGEPGFTHVQDVPDAIMAALSREVALVVPSSLYEELRDDFPPDLPPYIRVQ